MKERLYDKAREALKRAMLILPEDSESLAWFLKCPEGDADYISFADGKYQTNMRVIVVGEQVRCRDCSATMWTSGDGLCEDCAQRNDGAQ